MHENRVPLYDQTDNPTGCCPRFNPEEWDAQHLHFKDKLFVKAKTRSIMHIPVNMGKVFGDTFKAIEGAEATDPSQFIVLSADNSPWAGEHLFAVTKDVPGQEMIRVSGDFKTKVFEGPYKNARQWRDTLVESVDGDQEPRTFFFYTTCPKCAKYYDKNYVVGFVEDTKADVQDVRRAVAN